MSDKCSGCKTVIPSDGNHYPLVTGKYSFPWDQLLVFDLYITFCSEDCRKRYAEVNNIQLNIPNIKVDESVE